MFTKWQLNYWPPEISHSELSIRNSLHLGLWISGGCCPLTKPIWGLLSQLVSAKNVIWANWITGLPSYIICGKCFCDIFAVLEITTFSVWTFIFSLLYITHAYNWAGFLMSFNSRFLFYLFWVTISFFLSPIFLHFLSLPACLNKISGESWVSEDAPVSTDRGKQTDKQLCTWEICGNLFPSLMHHRVFLFYSYHRFRRYIF